VLIVEALYIATTYDKEQAVMDFSIQALAQSTLNPGVSTAAIYA
jgi:hypothetical protein